MLTPNSFFDILFVCSNILTEPIFQTASKPPGEAVPTRQIIGSAEFFQLPSWMGNAAASPRIHSPTRKNQTQARPAGCVLFGGPYIEEILGKKHGGKFGGVNHA